jgi:ADP-ribose pyrophosphatase YjhB (NUDIX family)
MNAQQYNSPVPSIILCVGAVVLREGKVLFIRQAYGSLKGKWSLPWGFVDGRNPDGSLETPNRAAVRETQEEAGIAVEVVGLLGIQNHPDKNGNPRLYLIFLCRFLSGEPFPDHHETDKAAWFSLDEMANFDEPFDKFCEWIARRVLAGQYHVIPPQTLNPYAPHIAFF